MRWRIGCLWKSIQKFVSELCLADRFLLGFMGIVLVYLSVNLFMDLLGEMVNGNVDTIVRTTGASIFGYFIGGSFLHARPAQKKPKAPADVAVSSVGKKNERKVDEKICYVRQQILIIGFIGLVSLAILVILPEGKIKSPSSIAAVSQLRDFVSGSVGLLIGHSTKGKS